LRKTECPGAEKGDVEAKPAFCDGDVPGEKPFNKERGGEPIGPKSTDAVAL
jgi:hypothetical protein